MKKTYKMLLVAIMLLQLTACKDDSPEEPNYIQFGELVLEGSSSTKEGTRAPIITGKDGGANYDAYMSLYGMYSGTTYINESSLKVNNGYLNTKYQWPSSGAALTFYAFAPALPPESGGGVTGLSVTRNTTDLNCEILDAYDVLSNQQDLLFGATGPFSSGVMQFEFQHVLSRITFQVSKSADNANTIKIQSITLTNVYNELQGKVEVSSSDNKIAATTWTYPGSKQGGNELTVSVADKTVGEDPTYLPSNGTTIGNDDNVFMFPHSSDQLESQDVKLTITYTENGDSKSRIFDLKEYKTTPWGMGQWINYVITFETGGGIPLHIEYKPWGTSDVESDALGRKLNLSETEVNFYKLNGTLTSSNNKVYFWTNQKEAYIEKYTYNSTTEEVNEMFQNLSRDKKGDGSELETVSNFTFNSEQGYGHFTLVKKNALDKPYYIVLNVGGLRKKILINILDLTLSNIPTEAVTITKYYSVGTGTATAQYKEIEFTTNGDEAYIEKYFYYGDIKTPVNAIFHSLSGDKNGNGTDLEPVSNFTFSGGSGTIKLNLKHFGKDGGYIILNIRKGTVHIREKIEIEMNWTSVAR